jgi:hypothetical protein
MTLPGFDGSQGKLKATMDGSAFQDRKSLAMLGLIVCATAVLYFVSFDPSSVVLHHDDGLYITTAKAMATGQGYRIVSLPYEPAATKYPPLYPLLLSLVWRVNQDFPSNIGGFVSISAIASLVFIAVTWIYLVKFGYCSARQALLITALVALNWRTAIVATRVLSETTYAALSVIGLCMAERVYREDKGRITPALLGLALGAASLSRSSGVALLIAVFVFFVLRRRFRLAMIPLLLGGLFVLAWIAWSYANRTTVTGVNVAYYTSYLGHLKEVVLEMQARSQSPLLITILTNIARNALSLLVVSIPLLCLGIDYGSVVYVGFALVFVVSGFVGDVRQGWRLLHVYVLVYLTLHLFWQPFVSYDRYLIPILPFLLLWTVREVGRMGATVRSVLTSQGGVAQKASAVGVGVAILVLISVVAYTNGSSLYSSLSSASFRKKFELSREDAESIDWIKHNTDRDDILVCARDPLYYLYTGRKALHSAPMTPGIYWRQDERLVFNILDEARARYLVVTRSDFEEGLNPEQQVESLTRLIEEHDDELETVFVARDGQSTIYRVKGDRLATENRARDPRPNRSVTRQ